MTEQATTIIELGNSFLLWLGGGSVVTIGVSAYLSKFLADRSLEFQKGKLSEELERLKGVLAKDVETHKLSLRRAEMLFERQIAAANDFIDFRENLMPAYFPGMDADDAASRVAERFEHIENQMRMLTLRHGVVLSDSTRDLIEDCRCVAAEAKFDSVEQSGHNEPSDEAVSIAKDILQKLKLIEVSLLQTVRT